MKLPDFTKDAGLNALRQVMGASLGALEPAENRGVLTKEEIETLTKQGIEVPLDQVLVLPDGTLAYKNSRIILYIRDITYYRGGQVVMPRFHVADCKTLENMRANDRFGRYVVATREDGLFPLNIPRTMQKITERLDVCQHCLEKLRWEEFGHGVDKRAIVTRFSISRFFAVYGKTLITKSPQHDANTAPLNIYSADFSALGDRIKAERGYRCDRCGFNLANNRRYLHAHHKNGQKHDSRPENIAILCVACHAEQYQHAHLKGSPDYLEFLRVRSSLTPASTFMASQPPKPAPPPANPAATHNWVAAAQEVARSHKLAVQDLRKGGGCLWVVIKNANHPAAAELKKLGFQFSAKRQAFWRTD